MRATMASKMPLMFAAARRSARYAADTICPRKMSMRCLMSAQPDAAATRSVDASMPKRCAL